jgi:hypothetical protein
MLTKLIEYNAKKAMKKEGREIDFRPNIFLEILTLFYKFYLKTK